MGLTANDLQNLSQSYLDAAQALVNYRGEYPIADPATRTSFNTVLTQIVVTADNLENQAVTVAIAAITTSVESLQTGIQCATAALKTIANVGSVIKIFTAAVALGTAIMNPVPPTVVVSALGGLVQAIHPQAAL